MTPNSSEGSSIKLTNFKFFFRITAAMSLDTTTTETADPADFIGLRNISTSSSFINYTMFDFNGDEVEDTEEELYRDSREIKRRAGVSKWNKHFVPEDYDIHSVPVIWSSDIWSFRIYGQFLGGPNFPIYYKIDHISRIWPEFRLYGHFLAGPTVDHISGTQCTYLCGNLIINRPSALWKKRRFEMSSR